MDDQHTPSFTPERQGEEDRYEQVVAALLRLKDGPPNKDPRFTKQVVAMSHAREICFRMKGATAPPRRSLGPMRELRDLGGLARKATAGKISAEDWLQAWSSISRRMRHSLVGTLMTVPRPEEVSLAIASEIERLKALPRAHRQRRRKRVGVESDAIAAVRFAYWELTGHYSGRAFNDEGKLDSPLVRFGREIDEIFGTSLFAVKDSRRLRD